MEKNKFQLNITSNVQLFASILRLYTIMKQFFLLIFFGSAAAVCNAQKAEQKIDSIFFHLYTDSLKKGTHNYINVDGKTADGKWVPLTAREIEFTSSYGKFEGNELVLPDEVTVKKLTVKAVLRSNPKTWKEITIWIKQMPDPELPSIDEVLKNKPQKKSGSKGFN